MPLPLPRLLPGPHELPFLVPAEAVAKGVCKRDRAVLDHEGPDLGPRELAALAQGGDEGGEGGPVARDAVGGLVVVEFGGRGLGERKTEKG